MSSLNGRLSPKEFRKLAEQLVANSDFITKYIEEELTFEKGKFRLVRPTRELPSLPFQYFFKDYAFLSEFSEATMLSTDPTLNRFRGFQLMSEE